MDALVRAHEVLKALRELKKAEAAPEESVEISVDAYLAHCLDRMRQMMGVMMGNHPDVPEFRALASEINKVKPKKTESYDLYTVADFVTACDALMRELDYEKVEIPSLTKAMTSAKSKMKELATDMMDEVMKYAEFVSKKKWSRAYINSLPDSAFLYIESGGEKDEEGKTKPRSLRHFPVKDADGNVDMPHLRNALSRIPQSDLPDNVKARVTATAERMLASASKRGEAVERAAKYAAAACRRSLFVKKDDEASEERYVLGVVLEPDPEGGDTQGDTYSIADVRKAAHGFMEDHQNVGLMHKQLVNGKVKILESYIAPAEFSIGEETVKVGTWLMAVKVYDDEIWSAIKKGELNAFSIGGTAFRTNIEE